jgi:hypothetical protein
VVNRLPIKPSSAVTDPPTVISSPKPAPPATTNAPVEVEVEVKIRLKAVRKSLIFSRFFCHLGSQ